MNKRSVPPGKEVFLLVSAKVTAEETHCNNNEQNGDYKGSKPVAFDSRTTRSKGTIVLQFMLE